MSSPVNQLGKNTLGRYRMGERHELPDGAGYRAFFPSTAQGEPEFFTGHSNAMSIEVEGDRVGWEIYRTKRERGPELTGEFRI